MLQADELFAKFSSLPLFTYFTEPEMRRFSEELRDAVVSYNVGEIIIHEGSEHGSLYLLVEGSVLVTKSGYDYIVAQLSPGSIFGEMSFFTKKPRNSNVIASDDVLVVCMDESFFNRISPEVRDKIKNYLIEILIKRIDDMNAALIRISR